jgi:tetratricopeptide (TPR) repeat protein
MILSSSIGTAVSASGTNEARLEGLTHYKARRFKEAIPYFDQVLARRGRDVEILIKRGSCYLALVQPEKALADFDRVNQYSARASRAFPVGDPYLLNLLQSTWLPVPAPDVQFAENWGNRGIALLMLGRNDEALQSFLAATSLWSRSQDRRIDGGRQAAAAFQGLGQAYHRLSQDELAVRAYSTAIAIYPADANGFAGRGDALASLRLFDRALADYSEAIALDPSHSRAYCGRGAARYELGRDESALADLDRAIALDPKLAVAYSHRGALHARRGHYERALADYDQLVGLVRDQAGPYKDRGGVLVRMGRFDRALKDLDEAIRLDPKRAKAYQNRGAAYNGLGQYERAVDDLSKALELDPNNAGAYTNRGLALFALGRYDESMDDLSAAIKLAPENAIPYFNRAECSSRLGLRDRALEDYQEAIRLDPRITAAYAASARLRGKKGQRAQAVQDFDMALQLDPKQVGLYYDRGNARREGGDWRGALADYDRAIVLDPQRAETYFARGWSRLTAGVEGADLDARAYLSLKGWLDPLSPYMALLGALGAREARRPADAQRILDEALANLSRRAWPVPVLRYFRGELTETALLHAAVTERQQTEAHAFVGLDRLQAGDRAVATAHVRWAKDHGAPHSIAADVARATLARIEPGSHSP